MHSNPMTTMHCYIKVVLLFLFSHSLTIVSSENFKTACELLKLPRDCHCQRTRGVPLTSLNESRLRCRQLTEINTNYRWSIVPYDRLAFETPNDNLTLYPFSFADVRARTIRFDVQSLLLTDRGFDNAYIGQLAISRSSYYGSINFQMNGQIFYGATVTNIFFKFMDFHHPISEILFSNARIYSVTIQSSKFYGFTNKLFTKNERNRLSNENSREYEHFLDYDGVLSASVSNSTANSLKIHRKKLKRVRRQAQDVSDDSSSSLPEKTIHMNISAINLPATITTLTILASINTTRMNDNYFPNNVDYSQTDLIELSYNRILSIGANAFRHLQFFEGQLILRHNQIEDLDHFAFSHLNSLQNLSLAHNSIRQISVEHFENLTQLVELDLRANDLNYLNGSIFKYLANLQVLYLNENPLKYLSKNLFNHLTRLKEIHLEHVNLFQSISESSMSWILNLAILHGKNSLRTNFDLSDVTFCLLSRVNQTFYHVSHHHSCSCEVRYFFYNGEFIEHSSIKPETKYLRLSPICNETESVQESEFLLNAFEDQCRYRFVYLDCDGLATATEPATTIELTEPTTITTELITEKAITITMPKSTKLPNSRSNDPKKLFIVLATLFAITAAAVIFVILWYRLKTIFKRRQKRKKLLEQQRRLNLTPIPNSGSQPSSVTHHPRSIAPRYASSEMLTNVQTVPLNKNQSQSQSLIVPVSPTAAIFNNEEALNNDSTENDAVIQENASAQEENRTTETHAIVLS